MANPRNISASDAFTATLGLSALYYGVTWIVDAFKTLSAANSAQNSRENQIMQAAAAASSASAQMNPNSEAIGIANMFGGVAQQARGVIAGTKLTSLIYGAGGGLMLFSAYRAGNSFSTGQSMGTVATVTGAATALMAGYALSKKI